MPQTYIYDKEILRYLPSHGVSSWLTNESETLHMNNNIWWRERFRIEFGGNLSGDNHFQSSLTSANINHGKYIASKKYSSFRNQIITNKTTDTIDLFNNLYDRVVLNYEYNLRELFPDGVKENMILYRDRFTFYLRNKKIKIEMHPNNFNISTHTKGCQNEIELRVCLELAKMVAEVIYSIYHRM